MSSGKKKSTSATQMSCWDGYKKKGTKIGKHGNKVNNCVHK